MINFFKQIIRIAKGKGGKNRSDWMAKEYPTLREDASISDLLPWLFNSDCWVREDALGFLLKKKWTPSSPEERAWVALIQKDWDRLAALGDASVQPLVTCFEDTTLSKEADPIKAIELLGRIGGKADALMEKWALENDEVGYRLSGLDALGHSPRKEWAIGVARKALQNDPNEKVQEAAKYLLRKFGALGPPSAPVAALEIPDNLTADTLHAWIQERAQFGYTTGLGNDLSLYLNYSFGTLYDIDRLMLYLTTTYLPQRDGATKGYAKMFAVAYAAYAGEVFRKRFAGDWLSSVGSPRIAWRAPTGKAIPFFDLFWNRLVNGEEDSFLPGWREMIAKMNASPSELAQLEAQENDLFVNDLPIRSQAEWGRKWETERRVKLDYTLGTLSLMDAYIGKMAKKRMRSEDSQWEEAGMPLEKMSAYIGEVIRRHRGHCRWDSANTNSYILIIDQASHPLKARLHSHTLGKEIFSCRQFATEQGLSIP